VKRKGVVADPEGAPGSEGSVERKRGPRGCPDATNLKRSVPEPDMRPSWSDESASDDEVQIHQGL